MEEQSIWCESCRRVFRGVIRCNCYWKLLIPVITGIFVDQHGDDVDEGLVVALRHGVALGAIGSGPGFVDAVQFADFLHEFRLEVRSLVSVKHEWLPEYMHPLFNEDFGDSRCLLIGKGEGTTILREVLCDAQHDSVTGLAGFEGSDDVHGDPLVDVTGDKGFARRLGRAFGLLTFLAHRAGLDPRVNVVIHLEPVYRANQKFHSSLLAEVSSRTTIVHLFTNRALKCSGYQYLGSGNSSSVVLPASVEDVVV